MREPYVAEIRLFSFGYAPAGWMECDGRLLAIDEHQLLFSLVGWRYGGDRDTTFAVPVLRSPPPRFTWAIARSGVYPPRADEDPMDEPYVGEIRMFGGRFAPPGWVPCDGRQLAVEPPHLELFAVIGTTYGGDERSFGVPGLSRQSAAEVMHIIAAHGIDPRR